MIDYTDYTLDNVTLHPDLWSAGDPVRPALGEKFKMSPGRAVYGLKSPAGKYVAFCCVSRTTHVPQDIMELSDFTSLLGTFLFHTPSGACRRALVGLSSSCCWIL